MRRIPTVEELVVSYWRKIGALYRKAERQKKSRTVAASSAKLRKVAASNSRAGSCVNQTTTKGRKVCMRTLKK